jgi:hypothetical protein
MKLTDLNFADLRQLRLELEDRLKFCELQGNELGVDTYTFRIESVKKEISNRVNLIKYS